MPSVLTLEEIESKISFLRSSGTGSLINSRFAKSKSMVGLPLAFSPETVILLFSYPLILGFLKGSSPDQKMPGISEISDLIRVIERISRIIFATFPEYFQKVQYGVDCNICSHNLCKGRSNLSSLPLIAPAMMPSGMSNTLRR